MENKDKKFKDLGSQLRQIRLDAKKTITDVSEAVELSEQELQDIEEGSILPGEELLVLLANHFKLPKVKMNQIWKLAGYRQRVKRVPRVNHRHNTPIFQFSLPTDLQGNLPVLLLAFAEQQNPWASRNADGMNVNVYNDGVMIEFLHNAASSSKKGIKADIIARVGMNIKNAKRLKNILGEALRQIEKNNNEAASDKA